MSLELLTTQKASISVALDDGAGNLTELGAQFHFSFHTGNARITSGATGLFVEAVAAGTDTLHITTMDGTVAIDIPITITLDQAAPVPALVVTFGTPEAK